MDLFLKRWVIRLVIVTAFIFCALPASAQHFSGTFFGVGSDGTIVSGEVDFESGNPSTYHGIANEYFPNGLWIQSGLTALENQGQVFGGSYGLTLDESQYVGPTIFRAGTYTLSSLSNIYNFWGNNPPFVPIPISGSITITEGPALASKQLGPGSSPGQVHVGEPIDVGSGNVYQSTTDYETAGANKLQLTRYYNSLANSITVTTPFAISLGTNWRTNYDRFLHIDSTGFIYAERPDGQIIGFTNNGASYTSDSDINTSLSASGSNWILSTIDGTIESYATLPSGNEAILKSIRYRDGYIQTLNYNSSNQLISVTDTYGRSLNFTYSNGLISTVATPDGEVISYTYDSGGQGGATSSRLDTVSYSTTPQTGISYLHEDSRVAYAVTAVLDENGTRYMSWTYDQFGRGLTSQFGSGALLTTVAYNDTDGSRVVTTPLGEVDTYKFTTLQGIQKVTEIDRAATADSAAASELFTYDANGYLASKRDWNGNLTQYTNDALGRHTKVAEAVGQKIQRNTTYSYLPNLNVPTVVVTPRLYVTNSYDAFGNLLTHTETDISTQAAPYSTKGQARSWTYAWKNGHLASAKKPRTDAVAQTRFIYDSTGALIETIDALGHISLVTSHTPGGLPLQTRDENGIFTTYTYDARLRLTSKVENSRTTSYQYDPAGNLISETLPDGGKSTFTYDDAHRRTSIVDPLGETQLMVYDANDDVIETDYLDSLSTLQRKVTNSFDDLGRLVSTVAGAGQTTTYAYDPNGNLLATVDGNGNTTTKNYDGLNRTINVSDSSGQTTTSFNDANQPLSVTTPNGATTTYVYDGFGENIQVASPDSGVTVNKFDFDGNLVQSVDGAGHQCNNTFDALDRVVTSVYPADTTENVTYTYDEAGHGDSIGRLTTVQDASGSLVRSYDFRGALTTETRTNSVGSFRTSYSFDNVGRTQTVTYPSGTSTYFVRDKAGHIIQVNATMPGATSARVVAHGLTYEPFGPMKGLVFANGVSESRTFDGDYRLTATLDAGSKTIDSRTYAYDGDNNVKQVQYVFPAATTQQLSYDAVQRLSAATGGYGSLAYGYDANGNRTSSAGTPGISYGYTPGTNRLSSVTAGGVQNISYTGSGNISDDGAGRQFTYNQANRLVQASQGSTVLGTYSYDALGHRTIKTTALGAKEFTYNPTGRLLEETSDSSMPTTDYIYLDDGRPLAVIQPGIATVEYVTTDQLGTPVKALDSHQAVVWNSVSKPFGESTVTGSVVINLRFPGQYYDAETGFNYNGFRDYVPSLGRYLESDPIGLFGGRNSYLYCNCNPYRRTDRLGLCPEPSTKSEGQYLEAPDEGTDPYYGIEGLLSNFSKGVDLANIVYDFSDDRERDGIADSAGFLTELGLSAVGAPVWVAIPTAMLIKYGIQHPGSIQYRDEYPGGMIVGGFYVPSPNNEF